MHFSIHIENMKFLLLRQSLGLKRQPDIQRMKKNALDEEGIIV
jgi:hypothetical protein